MSIKTTCRIHVLACAVSAALAAPAALAQQAASATVSPADGATNLDMVFVTGTTSAKTKLRSAVSVSTVGAEAIEQSAPRSSAEILRNIPGIRSESSGGEGNANIAVRGLPVASGGAKFLQLHEDGLPVMEFGDIAFGNADIFLRADNTVERIEAIRGGSASTMASNSPGGIVNFISKTGESRGGSVGITRGLGDWDNTRLDFDYGQPFAEHWQFNVGGFYRRGDGVRDAGFATDKGGQIKANLTRLFENGYVRVYGKYLDDRAAGYLPAPVGVRGSDGSPHFHDLPGFDAGSDTLYSPYIRRTLALNGDNRPNGAAGRRHASQVAGDRRRGAVRPGRLDADRPLPLRRQLGALRRAVPGRGDRRGDPGRGDRRRRLAPAGRQRPRRRPGLHRHGGAHHAVQRQAQRPEQHDQRPQPHPQLRRRRRRHARPEGRPVLLAPGDRRGLAVDLVRAVAGAPRAAAGRVQRRRRLAVAERRVRLRPALLGQLLHAQLRHPLHRQRALRGADLDQGPLSLDGSLRYDMGTARGTYAAATTTTMDVNGDGVIEAPEQQVAVIDYANRKPVDYDWNYLSYSFGGNYLINDDLAAFARYSRGARANADRLLFGIVRDDGSVSSSEAVNFVKQLEGGLKWRSGGLSLFATAFAAHTQEQNYEATSQRFLNRSYKAHGLELEAAYRTGGFGLNGGLTWTDAKIDKDQITPSNVGNTPRRQAKFVWQLTPSYRGERYEAGVNLIGTTSAYTQDSNQLKMPGYTQVNLFANYHITSALTLSASVNNLFNAFGLTEAEEASIPGDDIIRARSIAGRTASLGLRYDF